MARPIRSAPAADAAAQRPARASAHASARIVHGDERSTGLLAAAARWWAGYWDRRHPRRERTPLTHANVYILPTRAGWVFGLTLLVLLLASINYQLNLGHLLTFLLLGCAGVSMHMTHRNLRGLALHLHPPRPVHAGQPLMLQAVIDNADARARRGVGLRLRHRLHKQDAETWCDVEAGGQAVVHLSLLTEHRGRLQVPTIEVSTRFPFGLFRAWAVWRPAGEALVYPALEQPKPPLREARTDSGGRAGPVGAAGEFEGVRDYRRGDPLRQVAWKKSSRTFEATGALVSRDREARSQRELWLDWQATAGLATEARLSRLAAWVVAADAAGWAWGLRLPGVELPPAAGEAQRAQALEALALWSGA